MQYEIFGVVCNERHTPSDVHTIRSFLVQTAKSVRGSAASKTQTFTGGYLTAIILDGSVAELALTYILMASISAHTLSAFWFPFTPATTPVGV